jgi:hypothetical protein
VFLVRKSRFIPHLNVRFAPSTVGTADLALFGLPQMWHAGGMVSRFAEGVSTLQGRLTICSISALVAHGVPLRNLGLAAGAGAGVLGVGVLGSLGEQFALGDG